MLQLKGHIMHWLIEGIQYFQVQIIPKTDYKLYKTNYTKFESAEPVGVSYSYTLKNLHMRL